MANKNMGIEVAKKILAENAVKWNTGFDGTIECHNMLRTNPEVSTEEALENIEMAIRILVPNHLINYGDVSQNEGHLLIHSVDIINALERADVSIPTEVKQMHHAVKTANTFH